MCIPCSAGLDPQRRLGVNHTSVWNGDNNASPLLLWFQSCFLSPDFLIFPLIFKIFSQVRNSCLPSFDWTWPWQFSFCPKRTYLIFGPKFRCTFLNFWSSLWDPLEFCWQPVDIINGALALLKACLPGSCGFPYVYQFHFFWIKEVTVISFPQMEKLRTSW